jgi:hypothetical protein
MQCPSGKDEGNEDNAFLNKPGIANYGQNPFPLRVILVQMILYSLTASIVHLFASPTTLASPGDCLAIPAIDPHNNFR